MVAAKDALQLSTERRQPSAAQTARIASLGTKCHAAAKVGDATALARTIAAEPAAGAASPWHPRLGLDDLVEAGPCLVRTGGPLVFGYWERRLREQEQILGTAAGPGRTEAQRVRDVLGWQPRYDDLEPIVKSSLNWERKLADESWTA